MTRYASPMLAALLLAGVAAAQQPDTAALQPTVSLAQAVSVAERETGGRARKAEIERKKGVHLYEIKTVSKEKPAKVLVDPTSGNVMRVDAPGLFATLSAVFDRDDQREEEAALAALAASPTTLASAIAAAERETGGRAVEAALADQYGSMFFKVKLVKDGILSRAQIDPASGKVVTVPDGTKRDNGKDEDDD
jgi:uncharacterized membrane protein YkoI